MASYLEQAIDIAREAGALLAHYYERRIPYELKGEFDLVTEADRASERLVVERLRSHFPAHGIVAEEGGGHEGTSDYRWFVDPLDGTTNFLHGIPQFAISIALERQGKLHAAIVYDPIADALFTAERGSGAFLNDRRLRVATRQNLADCVIATGMPFKGHGDHASYIKELARLMPEVAGIRRFGAAALDLAWVAAGRFDGFWERGLSPWDMAAGILLIREAGGYVTDLDGGETMLETGNIAGGNEAVHRQLLAHIGG